MLKAAKSAGFFARRKWGTAASNHTESLGDARFSADYRHFPALPLEVGRECDRTTKGQTMPAQFNDKNTPDRNRDHSRAPTQDSANLDRRYGRIGIQAVAAALQFSTTRERSALGSVKDTVRIEERFIEIAA
jgi:hypothetical protein